MYTDHKWTAQGVYICVSSTRTKNQPIARTPAALLPLPVSKANKGTSILTSNIAD